MFKATSVFFVLGFFVTLLVAFVISPIDKVPTGTGIKAKPRADKPVGLNNLHSDLFLVLWEEEGEIKGIFTSKEKAKKFIELTQNESLYEIRVFNYGSREDSKSNE